jgi:hypothetical protein
MIRICQHVLEHLTVTKEAGKPTLYGTVFECQLKLESEEKRSQICAANHEQAVTNLCPCVGGWTNCPLYAPRPIEPEP